MRQRILKPLSSTILQDITNIFICNKFVAIYLSKNCVIGMTYWLILPHLPTRIINKISGFLNLVYASKSHYHYLKLLPINFSPDFCIYLLIVFLPPDQFDNFPFTELVSCHSVQFSSVVQSCPTLRPHKLQHARPPCPSPIPRVHSNSRPSSQWCHPAISSSVIPFSSCPQSLPASEFFLMSHLFAWDGQSTGVSDSASFLPKKSQGWSPSEWTGCISLQSNGLSRVFSNTTVQKHQFFGAQLSSQSNSHIHTWPQEKP